LIFCQLKARISVCYFPNPENHVNHVKKTISPTFTQDWFSRSIPGWQFILSRMAEKTPNLRILEVGVFEGRSTCWLLENFCKTPEATIVAIDSFQGGIEHQNMELGGLRKQFEDNIASVGSPAKIEVRAGLSLDQLCRLVAENTEPFDFISVDASHQAADVLGDAVLAFQLLKRGGIIAFDDYIWSPMRPGTENPLLLPKAAIDAFTTIYSQKLRILPNLPLYQLYIQKY
jgi:predicted O-methyltransferase YrrM